MTIGDSASEKVGTANVPSHETVEEAIPLSVMDAIQQLIEERKELEQFMEQNCLQLTELREQVRAETVTAEKDWRQQVETLRSERDTARQELRTAQVELKLSTDELGQVRLHLEQMRRQSAELHRLLDTMREEVARREQERCAESDRYQQVAKEHAELMEMMQGFEQLEAELHQQQEAVRKEREALIQERLQTAGSAGASSAQPLSRSPAPIGGDPRRLTFQCKHCGGSRLEARESDAGRFRRGLRDGLGPGQGAGQQERGDVRGGHRAGQVVSGRSREKSRRAVSRRPT